MPRPVAILLAVALLPSALAGWLLWAAPVDVVGRTAVAARDLTLLHMAGHLARLGDLTTLYDPDALTAALRAAYSAALPAQIWPYPPTALLLAVPVSLLSLPAAVLVYAAAGYGLALAATPGLPMPARIAIALSPAMAENALVGQNGALVAAGLAGGLLLIERRPAAAGALLGLLVVKPQFGLLLPVLFIAGRRWRSLAACAATATGLVALSTLLFGIDAWTVFFRDARPAVSAQLEAAWQGTGSQHLFCSVFMAGRSLGATVWQASLAQAGATLACAALTWRAGRTALTPATVPLVLIATAVACPWVHAYDMPMVAVAIVLLAPGASTAGKRCVLAVNWAWPGLASLAPLPNAVTCACLVALLRIAARQQSTTVGLSVCEGVTC